MLICVSVCVSVCVYDDHEGRAIRANLDSPSVLVLVLVLLLLSAAGSRFAGK